MASLEMLKKLLDEFAEKEAHTVEEINVVNQQIADLETRVATARTRQAGIAGDRERLNEMKAHYAGGAITRSERAPAPGGVPLPMQTPQPISAPPASVMPPAPPQQIVAPPPAPAPVAAAVETPKPNRFDLLDLFSPNENTPEPVVEQQAAPQPAPPPAPVPAPPPAPAPAPVAAAESPKEEEDDTVKSINDALRGLFR